MTRGRKQTLRTCWRCDVAKPAGEFYWKNGAYLAHCKECGAVKTNPVVKLPLRSVHIKNLWPYKKESSCAPD